MAHGPDPARQLIVCSLRVGSRSHRIWPIGRQQFWVLRSARRAWRWHRAAGRSCRAAPTWASGSHSQQGPRSGQCAHCWVLMDTVASLCLPLPPPPPRTYSTSPLVTPAPSPCATSSAGWALALASAEDTCSNFPWGSG